MPGLDYEAPEGKDEQITYYKAQLRELEDQLADFQASSNEIEKELEKELDSNEKQIRELRSKNEALSYQVEEWKGKCKHSKLEANNAQNALQKEITTLRGENRTLQLRLRDIEVSNDDFERQERIVQSSLEDLESKYNHSIERGVMQDEEIKMGEQERENLRIELQRLRDELADLKVEQEITIEKLKNTTAMAAKYGHGSLHHVPPPSTFSSSLSDSASVVTDTPSTPITTPTASRSTPSEHSSPPSPPMSEVSTTYSARASSRQAGNDPSTTPRPRNHQKPKKHARIPSLSGQSALPAPAMPASKSLYQIRGLIGQMQRLEQRVQSARSKLPGPVSTPPRASPRTSAMVGMPAIPTSFTMRSARQGRPSSTTSSVTSGMERLELHHREFSQAFSHVSRPSFGSERPASVADRSESHTGSSRPSSRTSGGYSSNLPQRPGSRTSTSGRVTPHDYDITPTPATSNPRRSVAGADDFTFIRRNTITSSIPLPSSGLPRRSMGPPRKSNIRPSDILSEDESSPSGIIRPIKRPPTKEIYGYNRTRR